MPNRIDQQEFLYMQEIKSSAGSRIDESGTIRLVDLFHPKSLSFSTPEEVGHYLANRLNEVSQSPYRYIYVYQSIDRKVNDSEGNIIKPYIHLIPEGIRIKKCSADDTLDRIRKGFLEQIAKQK